MRERKIAGRIVEALMTTKSKFVDSHLAYLYDIPESIHEPEVFECSTMMMRGGYSITKVVHYKYSKRTLRFTLSDWLKFRMLKRKFLISEKEPSVDRVSHSWGC